MVFFTDYDNCLSILFTANESPKEGLLLQVEEPLFARHLPLPAKFIPPPALAEWTSQPTKTSGSSRYLLSYLHDTTIEEDNFVTLGSRILSDNAIWGKSFDIKGEFAYIPRYWEWTEDILSRFSDELIKVKIMNAVYASLYIYDKKKDVMRAFCENWCPATNTLHLSSGEASISLWDLHRLSGLPVFGCFYDEVIPNSTELTGTDGESSFLPPCCKHLFTAFHLLSNENKHDGKVSLDSWINFWFRFKPRYKKPAALKETNSSRPTSISTPDGFTLTRQNWKLSVVKAYIELGITDANRKDVYLAAFLSCWLCAFVLPGRSSVIRPETFKAASLMASEKVVNLAVPVLAKIYHGLNEIVNSDIAGSSDACFPVHYVYGWLSHYFGTHWPLSDSSKKLHGPWMTVFSGHGGAKYFEPDAARKLIHEGIKWDANLFSRNKDTPIVDDADCSKTERAYFMSVRSSYLPARCDGEFIVESYSPHRFARQFCFLQDIPGALKENVSISSFDDFIQFTRACNHSNSKCRLICPARPVDIKNHTTQAYHRWWRNVHDVHYLDKGSKDLHASTRRSVVNRKRAPKQQRHQKETAEIIPSVGKQIILSDRAIDSPTKVSPSKAFREVQNNVANEGVREPYFKLVKRRRLRKAIPSYSMSSDADESQEFQVRTSSSLMAFSEIPSFSSFPETNDFSKWLGGDDLNKELDVLSHSNGENSGTNVHVAERAAKNVEVIFAQSKLTRSEEHQGSSLHEIIEEMGEVRETREDPPIIETANPVQPEASVFCADQVIGDYNAQHAQLVIGLWKTIRRRMMKTSFRELPLIETEIQKVLGVMKNTPFIDSSSLRERVQDYFDQAKLFLHHESSINSKLSNKEEQLKKLKAVDVQLEEYELEKRELEEKLSTVEANISDLRNKKCDLESIPVVTQNELDALDILQSALESSFEELKTLEWKP